MVVCQSFFSMCIISHVTPYIMYIVRILKLYFIILYVLEKNFYYFLFYIIVAWDSFDSAAGHLVTFKSSLVVENLVVHLNVFIATIFERLRPNQLHVCPSFSIESIPDPRNGDNANGESAKNYGPGIVISPISLVVYFTNL